MKKFTEETFTFESGDRREIFGYRWFRNQESIKGIVQISHGMAETVSRYRRFAKALTQAGFIVYGHDHRGHGKSADHMNWQGYLGEKEGFQLLIADIARLTDIIREKHPEKPIYLFSHSMGSFAAQKYIMDYPDKLNGVILAGSNGEQGIVLKAGKLIAGIESFIRGKKAKSKLMNQLIFGQYNRKFKPQVTGSEWLTRDKKELKKYLDNPYCGAIFPASFYYEFIKTLEYIENEENFYRIPKNLPIYIIAGSQDPVSDYGRGIKKLEKRYEEVGVEDLEVRLYEGARHELLNEINREEVTNDIIRWLELKVEETKEE